MSDEMPEDPGARSDGRPPLSDEPNTGFDGMDADPGSYPLGAPDGSLSPWMLFALGVSVGYFVGTLSTALVL